MNCDFCQNGKPNIQDDVSMSFNPPNKINLWVANKNGISIKPSIEVANCPFCGRKLSKPEVNMFKGIKAPQQDFEW